MMKKFLAICLVIIMSVFALSACGGDEADKKPGKGETEPTPEEVVTACIEDVMEADFEGAIRYVSEDAPFYQGMLELSDIDAALKENTEMTEEEKTIVKVIVDLAEEKLPGILDELKIEYSVGKATIDGDKAVVEVEVPGMLTGKYVPSKKFETELMGAVLGNMKVLRLMNGGMPEADELKSLAEELLPEVTKAVKNELARSAKGDVSVALKREGKNWKIDSIN